MVRSAPVTAPAASTGISNDDLPALLAARGGGSPAAGVERTVGALCDAMRERETRLALLAKSTPARRAQVEARHQKELQRIEAERLDALAKAEKQHAAESRAAAEQRDALASASELEYETEQERIQRFHRDELARLRGKLEDAVLIAEAAREAGEDIERVRAREFDEKIRKLTEEIDRLDESARDFVRSSSVRPPKYTFPPLADDAEVREGDLLAHLEQARAAHDVIVRGRSMRMLSGAAPYALGGAVIVGAAVIGGSTTLYRGGVWIEAAGLAAAIAGFVVISVLGAMHFFVRRSLRRTWHPFQSAVASCRATRDRVVEMEHERRKRQLKVLREREAAAEAEAHANLDGPIADVPRQLDRRLRQAEAKAQKRVLAARDGCTAELARIDAERGAAVDRALSDAAAADRRERQRAGEELARIDEDHAAQTEAARREWIERADDARVVLARIAELDRASQPPLASCTPENCCARRRTDWFRFGTTRFEPARHPGGLSSAPGFAVEMPDSFEVPACIGFPGHGNLVVEATPATRDAALRLVHAVLTRMLVSIPPGKLRFTFFDPVGLGESFASFMHLGDEQEQLVGERIWTDPRAIEQRLVDISEHVETVIQKYLRNEFEDIDAYNAAAGEIAEPYRIIVCNDFPKAFGEQSLSRMASLLRAGQRCGVHVVMLRDKTTELPDGIRADDLSAGACVLTTTPDGTGFAHAQGALAGLAIAPDAPLPESALLPILARIGREARSAARVEVPFESIAPKPEHIWSLSSAGGLRVPIGRAGATRLQHFALGEGTSQHALMAGKTGSGKSTLLHAIVTGLAAWYSPDELELWLIDFKKGVEFKAYAERTLPHARAVAIESDREFGLSVLEGLDTELARRGELFRRAGVQDIAGFRRAQPETRMPRVLLVIDEFQEFFLDDDRVAQNSAMFLDRLVRQGRAFGIHALLGSQTLGGAYALARSTMGQMGVRIALQCNEADSQLILSDENLAARLLSRPGEAIYNDAGGRIEGNSPFQVAYLPEAKRDSWLDEVRTRASGRYDALPRVIFEGDARAPLSIHPAARGVAPDPRGQLRLWLGEAVSIKDPTCVKLARAAGANVASICSRDDQATATTLAIALSIAREAPDAAIDIFDGTPADAPEYGKLESELRARGIAARFTGYRDIEGALAEIAKDVTDRGESAGAPRRFLVIHQLQRYRALRRNEDDFSFGGGDSAPSADKLLAGIVREGPVAGVHTIVTCDTLAALQRAFDRGTLREFDWKVLFQMSPSDSSSLIDSPAASRLGTNRAILHSEELGLSEKFRPYF